MKKLVTAYTLSECMEIMAEYVEAYEKRGMRNVVFCEDRLTLIAERALTRRLGGTFLSSVTTFARYLQTDKKVLSKQGSVMAIGAIMARLQKEGKLTCFKGVSGIENNAKCIYETLAQFTASEVDANVLLSSEDQLDGDLLKRKIHDLRLILEEYESMLAERGYVDESKYLALLAPAISADETLKDANVFFLCYTSFTAQAKGAIRAAAKTAKNVVGIFCDGKEACYTHSASTSFVDACSEVGKVDKENVGKKLDGEAEVLRSGLFAPEMLAEKQKKFQTQKIRLFEGADLRTEAEYVAGQIAGIVRKNPNARYRDFAVLVPSVEQYSLTMKKAFAEYKIPYFFDEKKSLKDHPVSTFLLDALECVRTGALPSAVQALTQNYFFGRYDTYRNYLLKYANHRGGALKEIRFKQDEKRAKEYDFAQLEGGRERFLTVYNAFSGLKNGRAFCKAVRDVLEKFSIKEQLETLQKEVNDPVLQGFLAQIFDALEKVLWEAENILGDKEMSTAVFASVLSEGLSASELSLIPLKSDAVFIGAIGTSRIEKIGTLFAVGLTDKVPATGDDSALLSDKDIEKLALVKTLVSPTVAEVNLRTRENVALNLCTFMDALYLSYPLSPKGDLPALSEIFRYVQGLFVTEKGQPLPTEKKMKATEYAYYCSSVTPATRRMIFEKKQYEKGESRSHERYDSLFEALRSIGIELLEKDYKRVQFGTIEEAQKLFSSEGRYSPSTLEKYFDCPFSNYAQNGLRLKEREEEVVESRDSGTFIHAVLDSVSLKIKDFKTETEVEKYAREVADTIVKEGKIYVQDETGRGKYATEKLVQETVNVSKAVYRSLRDSDYVVSATEKRVETEDFVGKVDRVDTTDEYVRIIDYKSGKMSATAEEYYTGRKLQLPLYMTAVAGEKTPAGLFYFPASQEYDSKTEFRMIGYMNGEDKAIKAFDKTLSEDKVSEYFDKALKKNEKNVMSEEDFRRFIDYAVYVAKQGKGEIADGYVEANPYRGACDYCRYGGACGFSKVKGETRKEEATEKGIVAVSRALGGDE